MLTIEVELLTGVYRAGLPDGSGAEWPPHPERLFSAFAQAWGDGGCDAEECAALEWLERQGSPWIEADNDADRFCRIILCPGWSCECQDRNCRADQEILSLNLH